MESSPLYSAVAPVRPVAAYIGGKRNLARRHISLIETIPHRTYAEPFVGMGGVYLRRRYRPQAEVINDWSQDVATFYRVLQRHYVAFRDMLRFQLTTRAEFERLSRVDPSTLTDLERAARFLYLQRLAFGGKVAGRNFGVSHHRPGNFDVTKLGPMLEDLHERLAGVIIERLPFDAFIRRYDTPETLFYLDPPYWGSETDYGAELFSRDQFAVLADVLDEVKGHFILALNDRSEVRETFSRFHIEGVNTTYSVQGGGQSAKELIITRRPTAAAVARP
ncbi:DNA adenine methylase [Brevundimonas diminuta]|uniref:DNA adenine methylase n=1 Tax=Brevundimonas diminuta TaxID=293 RepID=UPI0030FB26E8